MRKINPDSIRADFNTEIIKLSNFYILVINNLSQENDKALLAENIMISAAVLWESFINDIFIAYINRDSSQFIVHLENAYKDKNTQKQKEISSRFVRLNFPKHITVNDISSLLDSSGNNITFPNYKEIIKGANTYLAALNAEKISTLQMKRQAIVDLWISIRNHIAHRSKKSQDAMNKAMSAGALHDTGLKRGKNLIKDVGVYLKSKPQGHSLSRVELILNSMREISAIL